MDRKLRIILLNANSIVSHHKRGLLLEFLEENKPDILLLSESKLAPRHKLHIPGYSINRCDRLTPSNTANCGGGTCILTRDTIRHDTMDLPTFDSIEACGTSIHLTNGQKLNCFSVYHSAHLSNSINPSDLDELAKCSDNTPYIHYGTTMSSIATVVFSTIGSMRTP